MKLTRRDWIGTALVALIAIPYLGYLINGDMPFIQDARGMSATGLVLGAVAFFVLRQGDKLDQVGKSESALALGSLVLGLAALAFAETAAAEWLLAIFMISIAAVWAVEMLDHVGRLPGRHPAAAH